MRSGLAPVEVDGDRDAGVCAEAHLSSDRCAAVLGKVERRRGDEHRRQDMGGNRQGIDAGVEDAETAWLPDPVLARVPPADVFLPVDGCSLDPRRCKESPCCFHSGRVARVPGGEQCHAFAVGERLELLDFAHRCAGWLFHEDMLAGKDRCARRVMPELRRHAKRYGLNFRRGRQQRFDVRVVRDAIHLSVWAGRCDKLVVLVPGKCRQMLVAGDLADTDNGYVDGACNSHRQLSSSLSSNGPPARKLSSTGSKGEGSMALARNHSSE